MCLCFDGLVSVLACVWAGQACRLLPWSMTREIFGSSGREGRDWLRVVMARAEEEAVSRISKQYSLKESGYEQEDGCKLDIIYNNIRWKNVELRRDNSFRLKYLAAFERIINGKTRG